jgi:ABC-type polar amino acid transport system ATPase subunit
MQQHFKFPHSLTQLHNQESIAIIFPFRNSHLWQYLNKLLGCGKTTLLSCIVGVKFLNEGKITVLGGTPGKKGKFEVAEIVESIFSNIFVCLSISQDLVFQVSKGVYQHYFSAFSVIVSRIQVRASDTCHRRSR